MLRTRQVYTRKTKDEYLSVLKLAFKENDIDVNKVDNIIFSSVVPSINEPLSLALKEITGREIMYVAPGIKTGLMLRVDNPNEVGSDLIAVLVGAKEKYSYPTIIADLGTASKVLVLDKNGAFVSCLIMPGISLSLDSLTNKAALLPEISLRTPKSILAKNTVDAINAGVIYGHSDMINEAVKRYERELGYKTKHILCGGGSFYVKDILKDEFILDRDLCLEGLNLIMKKNEGIKNEK